ncbi:MAG: PAS domain-containing protein [Deltaproteobacteria bacterium]|nr:PAS domain-containing protein [Deltaproteobacteria bacterium]
MSEREDNKQFESLLSYLQQNRGFDFTGYKRPSLMRRISKRMQMVSIESFGDYMDYLEVHPEEFPQLFNTILINVTSFFRDPPAWDYLAGEIIPRILKDKKKDEPIRVWTAGCASGEEAYTIAMALAEAMGVQAFRQRTKVYATDVDEEALNLARQASYGDKELQEVDAKLKDKYFEPLNSRHSFRADFRRCVIFGRHDLVQDAPISHLDLLISRNTLMYFNAETQARILARFHFALKENGYLFLGRAELLSTHGNFFTPMDLKSRIFTRVPQVNMRDRVLAVAHPGNNVLDTPRQNRLVELALDWSPVAKIVVDLNGNLALADQKARLLFTLNPKDIGRPLQDLEISYRPVELRSLIEQAYAERRTVTLTSAERRFPNGEVQYLDVIVAPLYDEGRNPFGVSVSFTDVTSFQNVQEELRHSNEELQTTGEELQSSNEELETTNEELQSSNEELETTNEELQSTNEELETMNEELQSTNEELQTLNDELQQRTDEAGTANAFLQSILASLRSGAAVVDASFNILFWNHKAEDLWGLRADEVKGQSLLSLDIGLPIEQMREAIRSCLAGEEHQHVVLDATNRRGKAIKCRITCTPLMTSNRERQGAILLMDEMER